MVTGVALLAVLFQLGVCVGVIVFAVKLVGRLKDISESQKSIAESQAQLVHLLVSNEREKSNNEY